MALPLLDPKEVSIPDDKGNEKRFIISKFPAVAGREIIAKYTMTNLPKLGDYTASEETMLKLMSYVEAVTKNGTVRLSTRELVDNHVLGWEVLVRLEKTVIEYNSSFFKPGILLDFLVDFAQKLTARALEISTKSSAPSSPPASQPSMNSEQSTV